jgi:hypothetical protein
MSLTKKVSSRANLKQKSSADLPLNPSRLATYTHESTSTAGQTTINLGFAVPQDATSKANFFLFVNGILLRDGATNDYTFTNIQADNSSSIITLNDALSVDLNIVARWLGIVQPNYSLSSLQAQVNTNTTEIPKNYLINGAFDLWQRQTTNTITNSNVLYVADRWYGKNLLGTNGILTFSRQTGTLNGSKYAAQLQITTAPTALHTNGCELYQTIENRDSLELYNESASFGAMVKALGNVNQIGVQFYYATTETKVDTAIGSEVLVTVNSASFSLAQIAGQAIGTSMTTSGVIGVRIRITGVSSGNTYDLNNGFIVEQAVVAKGSTVPTFRRAGKNFQDEIAMAQRFYEKTWALDTVPGTVTNDGMFQIDHPNNANVVWSFPWRVRKRVRGYTATVYNPSSGAANSVQNTGVGALAVTSDGSEYDGVLLRTTALPGVGNTADRYHVLGDAEI